MDTDSPLTKKDFIFFNAARDISMLSDHKQKLGCVVVDHHRIISSGHNSRTKYHRLQAELDKYFFQVESIGPIHAELSALLPLLNKHTDLSGATLYVYRQTADACLAMARPCDRCMKIIKQCGIKKIKYTTNEGFAVEKLVYWGNYGNTGIYKSTLSLFSLGKRK